MNKSLFDLKVSTALYRSHFGHCAVPKIALWEDLVYISTRYHPRLAWKCELIGYQGYQGSIYQKESTLQCTVRSTNIINEVCKVWDYGTTTRHSLNHSQFSKLRKMTAGWPIKFMKEFCLPFFSTFALPCVALHCLEKSLSWKNTQSQLQLKLVMALD